MANVDRPQGLRPVRMLNGSSNIPVNRYPVAAGNSTAIFIGDLVIKTATTNQVIPQVTTTNAAVLGVVVGIDGDFGDLTRRYLPASTAGNVFVADSPETIFAIQEDGNMGVAAIGTTAAVLTTAGSTTTGLSAYELDSDQVGTTTTGILKVLRAVPAEDNDATSTNAEWEVLLQTHQYSTHATLGAGV